ncbi:MAG: GGDEF domain-containing protein [Rhodocyclaceae bacterium]|jgi:diguanylate cyclase (GGDEF)-like protein|nr:GGDEF domain-containing protein [Rhodocyclaceae bacterium]
MPHTEHSLLLSVLGSLESLSGIFQREELFRTLTTRTLKILKGRAAILYRVRNQGDRLELIPSGWTVADGEAPQWESWDESDPSVPADPFLADCLISGQVPHLQGSDDGWRVAFPIGPLGTTHWLLEIHTPYPAGGLVLDAITGLLRCFENLLHQWEYANLDTLTRLLNRKTFDEQFGLLIADAARAQRLANDRRHSDFKGTLPCWLGVVDIDHFKRINDNFGHLFGDEVLLRIANLMQGSFRASDKLFRFGGEEFVVMLRGVSEDQVGMAFERFRETVVQHDFPQVGRVTCSVGYARIDPALCPAELLGRADQALYYSKQDGRNKTHCFDELVMRGIISLPSHGDSPAQADADIFFS